MLPFLNIFGVAIAFPPLLVIIGIWFGASLAEKHAARHKLSGELVFNLIFTALIAYIIGGRLSYAIQHPSAFSGNLLNLISRNTGLFDPFGGALIALIAVVVFGQRKNLELWPTLDSITPALAVAMLALPLANLASGEAYGAPSNHPWAIELWGASRHPVQLYEALGAALILWAVWPGKSSNIFPGSQFLQFTVYSALARLFFEGFRGNSLVITSLNFRAPQVIAWMLLAVALWLYFNRRPTEKTQAQPNG
jgi:phosphatidylglycerol:prolipoprotein diacylglycerol transferase